MRGTVLMIHGMFSRPWVWDRFVPLFEDRGWRCLTPTLRHHDLEPADPPPAELGRTSVLDYADDLEDLIRSMAEPPVAVGHSMGGLLSQILAARGLLRAAVLLCPAAPAGVIGLSPAVLRSFMGVLTQPCFWRKPVRPSYGSARFAFFERFDSEDERRSSYERLVHESGRAVFEIGLWPFDFRRATRVDSSAVNCPILVVGAGRDHATPAFAVRQTARRYATASYRELPDMAHWVLSEPGWEQVANLALDWLDNAAGETHFS